MKQNLGGAERVVRIVLGVILLTLTVVGPRTWWGLVGLVPLANGLWGYCAFWHALGVSTRKV